MDTGLTLGLLVTALLLGLRHGVDWDHIAAITDITAVQEGRRRGVYLGTLYALGHAAVVFVIGMVAIVAGRSLPEWADILMGRIVGGTLIFLGAYVLYGLLRHGAGFKMRSRWMLVLSAVRSAYLWFRRRVGRPLSHDHPHSGVHHGTETSEGEGLHRHSHRHEAADPFADYGPRTSLGIGMLHGVGAETPTQVLIFLAAADAGGTVAGVVILAVFLLGLMTSNSLVTLGSSAGLLASGGRVRTVLGGATALASFAIGTLLVFGRDAVLPSILAG